MADRFLEIAHIKLENGMAFGVLVETPEAPILLIRATKGFIMCGALDVASLDEILPGKIAAAKISRVKTFDDLLKNKVVAATLKARELGVTEQMTGKDALEKMM